jgi:hypothetical protein
MDKLTIVNASINDRAFVLKCIKKLADSVNQLELVSADFYNKIGAKKLDYKSIYHISTYPKVEA